MTFETILASGTIASAIGGFFAWLQHRQNKKSDLNTEVRKELWQEIANLRSALRDAGASLLDWQGRYVTLLGQHQSTVEQLNSCREQSLKMSGIIQKACMALDRVEEIERMADQRLDIEEIKAELACLREDAALIQRAASSVN